MTDTITITEAPPTLLEAARRVSEDGARPTLLLEGQAYALVTVEDAEALEAWEDARDVELAKEAMEESRRSGIGPIPAADVFAELERTRDMPEAEAEQAWAAFEERYRVRPAETDAPGLVKA